jgi:hypothetical protein
MSAVLTVLLRWSVCVDCLAAQTGLEGHGVVTALKHIAATLTLHSEAAECEVCRRRAPVFHVG